MSASLYEAIHSGELDRVKQLLTNPNINVNYIRNHGKTYLMETVIIGREDMVKELLKHPNIDVNLQNDKGQTALMIAVRYENIDVIKELLAHPNIKVSSIEDDHGETAIDYTTNTDIKNLLEMTNPNEVVNDHGKTKLMIATINGTIRLLQHPKIDTNIQDIYGKSALTLTTGYGDLERIELLLANQNTDVNIINTKDNGTTAFHMIVDYIIDMEGILSYDKDRLTRIIRAYKKRQDFEIDAVDDDGDTVLMRLIYLLYSDKEYKENKDKDPAYADKLLEVIKLFIEEGVNPIIPNNNGETIVSLSEDLPDTVRYEIQTLYATYLSKQ